MILEGTEERESVIQWDYRDGGAPKVISVGGAALCQTQESLP